MTTTQKDYLEAVRDRDKLISDIQLENLALKGALRESDRHLQTCVELMQRGNLEVPLEVASHLGMVPPIRKIPYVLRSKR